MVYESDFYTTRRPYTRPISSHYTITNPGAIIRPITPLQQTQAVNRLPHIIPYVGHKRLVHVIHTPYPVIHYTRQVPVPIRIYSRVRPSVIAAELQRIRDLPRPSSVSYVSRYLNSKDNILFDDEAREIRARADSLLRKIHVFVPRPLSSDFAEVIVPERMRSDDYIRRLLSGRNSAKKHDDESPNWYDSPAHRDFGTGHLAAVSYTGGRPHSRRRPYYKVTDLKAADVQSDVNLLSYYAKNRQAAASAYPDPPLTEREVRKARALAEDFIAVPRRASPDPEPVYKPDMATIYEPRVIREPEPELEPEPEPAPEPVIAREPIVEPKPEIKEKKVRSTKRKPSRPERAAELEVLEPEPTLPEPEPTVKEPETIVPEAETVVPEPEPIVPEPELKVLEPEPAVCEQELVPEPELEIPEQEPEVPQAEQELTVTESESIVPEESTEVPEQEPEPEINLVEDEFRVPISEPDEPIPEPQVQSPEPVPDESTEPEPEFLEEAHIVESEVPEVPAVPELEPEPEDKPEEEHSVELGQSLEQPLEPEVLEEPEHVEQAPEVEVDDYWGSGEKEDDDVLQRKLDEDELRRQVEELKRQAEEEERRRAEEARLAEERWKAEIEERERLEREARAARLREIDEQEKAEAKRIAEEERLEAERTRDARIAEEQRRAAELEEIIAKEEEERYAIEKASEEAHKRQDIEEKLAEIALVTSYEAGAPDSISDECHCHDNVKSQDLEERPDSPDADDDTHVEEEAGCISTDHDDLSDCHPYDGEHEGFNSVPVLEVPVDHTPKIEEATDDEDS